MENVPQKIQVSSEFAARLHETEQKKRNVQSGLLSWERERLQAGIPSLLRYHDLRFTYTLDDGRTVVINEDCTAEVGHRVWDTAVLMSKMFEEWGTPWSGKKILELGSGTGLLGIVLAQLGARVTLTDRRQVLDCLTDNVFRNTDGTADGWRQVSASSGAARVLELNWDAFCPDEWEGPWDLIVGADLAVLRQHIPSLVSALRALTGKTKAIMGNVVGRDGDTAFREAVAAVFECSPLESRHPDYSSDRIYVWELHELNTY
eukprot:TRINITY_DN3418_c0_g2_i1.p2 TRINITY_DN3418_c0_g2~~TRINITY_DN3418_c0_g2_i1.p2  ORF type:complete len:261 (-),score=24.08 TRINITY_DN3418_c0_g2_i1:7-789(-)